MTTLTKRFALGLTLLLVVAACSGAESETFSEIGSSLGGDGDRSMVTGDSGGEEAGAEAGAEPAPPEPGEPDRLGSGGITPVALPINLGRDIIFTADMTVAVSDVAAAGEEATAEIQRLGGFLFGQRTAGEPDPTSVLTFKIEPESFQEALVRLGSIGEIRHQDVNASDVTDRIVDLASRIATASASVDRLRTLLSQATDIKAVVELESELLARETDLETLRGSLRTLEDQVALATIVLSLTEAESHPAFSVAVTSYGTHDDGLSCPGSGDLEVETATPVTVCYEISNTGDTWLADFELRDPVLDIELADLVSVFGDPDEALEPGDSLLLAAEVTLERDLRSQTTITATSVDEESNTLSDRPVSQTESIFVNTVDPEGVASFGDGLAASWDLMVRLAQVLVLAAGAVLPFAWLPLAAWIVLRYRRKAKVEV